MGEPLTIFQAPRDPIAPTDERPRYGLLPCPDCQHQCSTYAETCPSCGRFFRVCRPTPEVQPGAGWSMTVFWGIMLAWILPGLPEAQEILDEMSTEHLLPFKLSAGEVTNIGPAEYRVRFNDSRLHSVDVNCRRGKSFKENFRNAVLERVKKISGRLHLPIGTDRDN